MSAFGWVALALFLVPSAYVLFRLHWRYRVRKWAEYFAFIDNKTPSIDGVRNNLPVGTDSRTFARDVVMEFKAARRRLELRGEVPVDWDGGPSDG